MSDPSGADCTGIDQTRGWFYTLMVLSTALFGKPAFKSLVCNGLILAEDGKKMSKRLQNYPVSCAALVACACEFDLFVTCVVTKLGVVSCTRF